MTEVEDPAPEPSPSSLDAGAVVVAQGTSATDGLTPDEAARRLERHGPNLLDVAPPVPAWQRFAAQFRDPLVLLLAGAIAVSLVAWIIEGGEGVPVEAVVIGAIVLANGVLGFIQERGGERAALQRMAAPTATVVRGGLEVGVPAADVVPGRRPDGRVRGRRDQRGRAAHPRIGPQAATRSSAVSAVRRRARPEPCAGSGTARARPRRASHRADG